MTQQTSKQRILVICARRYNGHELWTALGIFKKNGFAFDVTSTDTLIKDELTFQPNVIPKKVYDFPATPETFDPYVALVVVSGNMADTEAYWEDSHVQALVKTADKCDKTVAAICCSVPTLWQVVKDTKVSFFPLQRSRRRLQAGGAILQNVAVTVDKNKVTAEHQMATQMWAEEICNLIQGKPPIYQLTDSGFRPKGTERRFTPEILGAIEAARNEKKG